MMWESSKPSLEVGATVDGRYQIAEHIGAGAIGDVYRARRIAIGDDVALKRLRPEAATDANRTRLNIEARAAARIAHPSVVRILDFGRSFDGQPYIVMEALRGRTLEEVVAASGPLELSRALAVFADLCAALEAGHQRGVVHRDIKPANIMLTSTDSGGERAVLFDYGLASFPDDGAFAEAMNASLGGTCRYMAPEQLKAGPATPAVDIFATGVVLYEMLTGVVPFDGETSVEVMLAVESGRYADPSRHRALPPRVLAAIDAALAPDPTLRPRSAAALARLAESMAQDAAGDSRKMIASRAYRGTSGGSAAERFAEALDAALDGAARGNTDFVASALSAVDELRAELATKPSGALEAAAARAAGWLLSSEGRFAEAAGALRGAAERAAAEGALDIEYDARTDLAECYLGMGSIDAALGAIEKAAACAAGDPQRAAAATIEMARFLRRAGRFDDASRLVDGVVSEMSADASSALLANTFLERAILRFKRGDWDGASADAREARAHANSSGQLPIQQRAVAVLAAISGESGDSRRAEELERRALELARALGSRRREAFALANLGEIQFNCEDPGQALAYFQRALAIFVEIGDRACEGDARVNVGRALYAKGLLAEAAAMLERGIALADATGRAEYVAIAYLYLSKTHAALGEADRALRAVSEAIGHFEALKSHHLWQAELHAAYLLKDQPEKARPHLERARSLLSEQKQHATRHRRAPSIDEALSEVSELLTA